MCHVFLRLKKKLTWFSSELGAYILTSLNEVSCYLASTIIKRLELSCYRSATAMSNPGFMSMAIPLALFVRCTNKIVPPHSLLQICPWSAVLCVYCMKQISTLLFIFHLNMFLLLFPSFGPHTLVDIILKLLARASDSQSEIVGSNPASALKQGTLSYLLHLWTEM